MGKMWMLLSFVAFLFSSVGCTQEDAQRIQTGAKRIKQEQRTAKQRADHKRNTPKKLLSGASSTNSQPAHTGTTKQTALAPAANRTGTPPDASHANSQHGTAAYYHSRLHGRLTASGERYDQHALSAAHPTYPFGTKLRVINLANKKSVEVRVNDRGPSTPGRIIDVSRRAAQDLDLIHAGLAQVRLEVLSLGDGKTFHRSGIGTAAYYHARLNGRRTASGERYNQDAFTAAHNVFPFGTKVRVTNLTNDKSVVVRINDRGPSTPGRIIDVSRRVAKELDFLKDGIAQVKLEVLTQGTS